MLTSLRVRNLAIVERIEIEFRDGLNVITGETGAGKSILIGALELVLGGRSDRNMIRAGATEGTVEACFHLTHPERIAERLTEFGLEPDEDGALILRRAIAATGAGKTLVNGCPATVQMLRQIGDLLLDMHGPHAHQSLLNESFQIDVLDAFGGHDAARAGYDAAYAALRDAERRIAEFGPDPDDRAERLDLLAHQIREIEDAALSEAEEHELNDEHARAAHAQRILELAGTTGAALMDDDSSAFQQVVRARQALDEWAELLDEAKPWAAEIESIAIQLKELASAVTSAAQSVEADPARLQWIEDRLALLHRLKRKHGGSIASVLAFLEEARVRRDELAARDERLAEARATRDTAR